MERDVTVPDKFAASHEHLTPENAGAATEKLIKFIYSQECSASYHMSRGR